MVLLDNDLKEAENDKKRDVDREGKEEARWLGVGSWGRLC